MALQAAKARVHVCGQHGACQIAQMLDAIDIGKCRSDEKSRHNASLSRFAHSIKGLGLHMTRSGAVAKSAYGARNNLGRHKNDT
jgi:hypothetical protein